MTAKDYLDRIASCDGGRPYVFVSYASEDWEAVYPDVMEFQRRGYNIWLDEKNLDKTKDSWKEDAIEAIHDVDCKLVVFYVSAHSMSSDGCTQEMFATMDSEAKQERFGKSVKFIAVEVHRIDDMSTFAEEQHRQITNDRTLSKEERRTRARNIFRLYEKFFNSSNEKVRIHYKDEPDRRLDYYEDILSCFPEECYDEQTIPAPKETLKTETKIEPQKSEKNPQVIEEEQNQQRDNLKRAVGIALSNGDTQAKVGKDAVLNKNWFDACKGFIRNDKVKAIFVLPFLKIQNPLIKEDDIIIGAEPIATEGMYNIYIGSIGKIMAPEDSDSLFGSFLNASVIDIAELDTSNVTDMRGMFRGCSHLTDLDVSNWNTANVTDMSGMFYGCSELTKLDLNGWNTANVTNVSEMFYNCDQMTKLDVSSWNTANVTDMSGMFGGSDLVKLDVNGWNTTNVRDMSDMFRGCIKLAELDVSNWNTANVTDMSGMFYYCFRLAELDLSEWNTASVTDMREMFWFCSGLTELDVSGWNTTNVTDMGRMFSGCSNLRQLDLSCWDISRAKKTEKMVHDIPFWKVRLPHGANPLKLFR